MQSTQYVSIRAIVDKLIVRSPAEIRMILWSRANKYRTVFEITQTVEDSLALAYDRNGKLKTGIPSSVHIEQVVSRG